MKTGPAPSCVCGTCPKCRQRDAARRRYHGVVHPPIAAGRYQPQTVVLPEDEATLGYLAGLFDGEGCVSRNNRSLVVQIAMTDRAVIEWLGSLGGVVAERKVVGNRKRCWGWRLLRQRDVWAFLLAILPHLRVKREAAVEAVLDIWGRELLRDEALGAREDAVERMPL